MRTTNKTHFLLATSAIVGVAAFSATPAYAQLATTAGGGTPISNPFASGDQDNDLFLQSTEETIENPTDALTIGSSSGATGTAAITAEDSSGTTELTLNNQGASGNVDVTVLSDGATTDSIQKEGGNALNVLVEGLDGNNFTVDFDGDVNLSGGTAGDEGSLVVTAEDAGDVTAEVTADLAGSVALEQADGATGTAQVTFDAGGAQSVAGDIVAIDPDGTDLDGNTAVVATGSGTIVNLAGNIGSETSDNIVNESSVTSVGAVGDVIAEAGATLNVTGNVNAGVVGVDSSSAAAGITVTGDVDAGIITLFEDDPHSNAAAITFNGGAAQTVNGDIIADSADDTAGGDITVTGTDTDVTFNDTIGTTDVDLTSITGIDTAQSLGSLTVASDAVATLASDAAFDGDVTISSATADALTNNSGATLSADNIVGTGAFTNAGTADVATDVTVGTVTNTGTLDVAGNVAGAAAVTNYGTLDVTTNFAGTATLDNQSGGTTTIGGVFSSTGAFTNAGTATVTGDISGASAVTNSGTLTLNGNDITAAANVTNTGTLNLNSNNTSGTINNEDQGTLVIQAGGITNGGTINLASGSADANSTVDISALTDTEVAITGGNVDMTGEAKVLLNPALEDGQGVTVVDSTATLGTDLSSNFDVDNIDSALFNVTLNDSANFGSAGIIATLDGTKSAAQTAATLGVTANNGSILNQAGLAANDSSTTSAFDTGEAFEDVGIIINDVLAGRRDDATDVAEQLSDATGAAGAASDAGVRAFSASSQNVGNRLASLRGDQTSVAAGNQLATDNVWFEANANFIDQDARKGASGFDVDSYGGTIGYDQAVSANSRLGVAFTYSQSDVEGDGGGNIDQDVDSYLINLYGEKGMGNSFVNGGVHFGVQDVEISETLGANRFEGDYANEQYGANVEVGYNYNMGKGRFIPTAGLSWAHIGADDVDMVNGSTSFNRDFDSKDQVEGTVGLRYEHDYQTASGGMLRPAVYGNFGYDFASDEVATTTAFGSTLINDEQAEIAEESVGFGAAFTYESPNRTTAVQIGYDGEYRDEYLSHGGKVRFSYRF